MTTARDALRTTSIFRFRTLENNLIFLIISKHVKMTCDSKINLYVVVFFMFNELRCEVIARFIDIGGIV
jgi:hypothetical protein